jgi:hypothetical protein
VTLYGTSLPSIGDVVTGERVGSAATLGTVDRGYVGRLISTWEINGAVVGTVRLDDGDIVRANLKTITVVDRYTGPSTAIRRWSGGYGLNERYDWRRGQWEVVS